MKKNSLYLNWEGSLYKMMEVTFVAVAADVGEESA